MNRYQTVTQRRGGGGDTYTSVPAYQGDRIATSGPYTLVYNHHTSTARQLRPGTPRRTRMDRFERHHAWVTQVREPQPA